MNFLERIVKGAEFRSGLTNSGWLIDAFDSLNGVTASYSGQKITVDKAMQIVAVFAAVRMISETVGSLPLKVYRSMGDGTKIDAREHRAWRMLHDRPNPLTPSHRFWASAVSHYLLWGNIFVEKLRNEQGLVDELWLLDPAATNVSWDPNRRVKRFYQRAADGTKKEWTESQVLHILGFSTDGLIGLSPIQTARQSLGTALAREEFEGTFYKRGGVLPGVLKHPNTLSQGAHDRLKLKFKDVLAKGEWAVLEEGLEATPLSMPLEDMQFVANKELSLKEIANLFNLPVSFLNGSSGDSLTYATVESNQIQYAQLTLSPIVNAVAKSLAGDSGIFPQTVFFPEFVLDGIHRGDMRARVEYYEKMHGMKALTVNEIRALENREPLPGGDKFPEPPPQLAVPGDNTEAPEGAFSLPAKEGE